MTIIATAIFITLILTAILHTMWAVGILWPAKSAPELLRIVVGVKGTQMPGFWLTIIVAFGIASAGVLALWGADVIALPLPMWMRTTGMIVLIGILLIRGIACYLPFGPFNTSLEPFLTLNRRYFSPLILAIGIGFLAIYLN